MPAATRLNDQENGTCDLGKSCCPHSRTGTNGTVSENVFINGLGAHRKGDTGMCNCPHNGIFVTTSGSSTVFINGLAATRVGDETTCQNCGKKGSHVTGSDSIFIGG